MFQLSEEEILEQIRYEKEVGENYVQPERLKIEADLQLIRGIKAKGKDDYIWDHTTFSHVKALVARSFRNKIPVTIRGDKNGADRTVKMLNACFKEDQETTYSKAIRLMKEKDKYSTGLAIIAKTGWDGIYKRNTFQVINPLLAVPDPYGDYFTGNYRYIGFYMIKTKQEVEEEWYDTSYLQDAMYGEKDQKRKEALDGWLVPQTDKTVFDFYIHFTHIGEKKAWFLTDGNCKHIFKSEIIKPWDSFSEKEEGAINFPFAFYYYDPIRGNFFGDRIANYTRDVQKWKSEMRNLQKDKVRAELYPMYLYNKDYVNGKDLSFWFNKGIPVSTGLEGPQVSLGNIVSPIVKDLRTDNTNGMINEVEYDLQRATSIGPVVQGSTPARREALWTNKLVQDNTDINLSLNEEIDAIGDEQYVKLWFSGYYQNFEKGDRKTVFAGSSTGQIAIVLKREDFVFEGNLTLSIETSAQTEERRRKEAAAYIQTAPLILQDPTINEASKRTTLRRLMQANWISDEDIDAEVPKTPQQKLQEIENEQLKAWIYVPINADDDDEQHLIAMGDIDPNNELMVAHQFDHIMASIKKWKPQEVEGGNQMLNASMSQAMAQAGSEVLNQ